MLASARHKRTKVTPVLLAKSAYISSKSFAEFLGEKKIALSFYALILLLLLFIDIRKQSGFCFTNDWE